MPIEHHVLPPHDIAGFKKWFNRNPQLRVVLQQG
jgi:hypothetical protein